MSSYPETEQRIREAAFRALAEHGYADLSLKDIGAELGQNPSIIYHYFDSKDDLLLSMLDTFVEIFVGHQSERPESDAEAALREFVEQVLHPTPERVERAMHAPPDDIETALSRVYVELWAHATWDAEFREKTTEVEARLQTVIARLVRSGVESGEFREVDAEATADHLLFLVRQGLHTRTTTNRRNADTRVQSLVDEIISDLSTEE